MSVLKYILLGVLIQLALCSSVSATKSLGLTIYSNNFAVVADVRNINFDQGLSYIYFTDVATTIQTDTVVITPLDPNVSVSIREQSFLNNLADKNSLLTSYLNQNVTLTIIEGMRSNTVTGTLLAFTPSYIINSTRGIQIFDQVSSITVPNLPQGFLTKPTLVWKANSTSSQSSDYRITYRATGITWTAVYTAILSPDETTIRITVWVTIDNASGKRYSNTTLKLIAGEVNIAAPTFYFNEIAGAQALPAAGQPTFTEQTFADYHMFTYNGTVDIGDNQKKQVQLIPYINNISVNKFYLVSVNTGGFEQTSLQAQSTIEFNNTQNNSLGIPLPKGTFRVYKTDADGVDEFIGENAVDYVPVDQNLSINIGASFDLVVNKTILNRTSYENGYDADVKLEITNQKDSNVSVRVDLVNLYGSTLKVTQTNANQPQLVQIYASTFQVSLSISSGQTVTIQWNQNQRNL